MRRGSRTRTVRSLGFRIFLAGMTALAGTLPAQATGQPVDELLARALSPKHRVPYELTAHFAGTLVVSVRTGQLTVTAAGSFREWRKEGDPTVQRHVTVETLHLPLVLRPFAGALRRVIEEKVEKQSSDSPDFHSHDFFILDSLAGGRYVIAGVHHAIVNDAIDRYTSSADRDDIATRRLIARWLYTSPMMRKWLVRPGPPYAFEAIVGESGLIYTLSVFYDWGRSDTSISYTMVGGEPYWSQVTTDIQAEVSDLGPVRGQMSLTFTNHCLGCK
jgi:hypothetical protein